MRAGHRGGGRLRAGPAVPVLAAFGDAGLQHRPRDRLRHRGQHAARLLKAGDLAGACQQLPGGTAPVAGR